MNVKSLECANDGSRADSVLDSINTGERAGDPTAPDTALLRRRRNNVYLVARGLTIDRRREPPLVRDDRFRALYISRNTRDEINISLLINSSGARSFAYLRIRAISSRRYENDA